MTKLRNVIVALGAALALTVPAGAQVSQAAAAYAGPKHTSAELAKMAAAAIAKGTPAAPCTCLKEYVDWCKQTNNQTIKYLLFTLTQISNNSLVGYAEGSLGYNGTTGHLDCGNVMGWPWFFNEYRDASHQPFNRPPTQKAIINIHPGSCTATVKIGANAVVTTPTLLCANQIFTAADPARGCLWVFTFKKVSAPVIY